MRFGMTRQQVVAALGKPEDEDKYGVGLLYPSKGFSVSLARGGGAVGFCCFTRAVYAPSYRRKINDFAGTTPEGIGMGSGEAQIKAAYGKPDKREANGDQVSLTYGKLGLHFLLLKDNTVQLTLRAPAGRKSP